MCIFITMALPAGADVALLDGVAARFGRCLVPIRNDSVQRRLPPGELYFRTTVGHCDCDTALDMGPATNDGGQARAERAQRLRRKGWSEAKIARSLDQAEESTQTHLAARRVALAEDLQRWQGFLGALLDHGLTRVHLLIHMYSGQLEDPMDLSGPMSHRLRDLGPDRLAMLERDVLHEIRR